MRERAIAEVPAQGAGPAPGIKLAVRYHATAYRDHRRIAATWLRRRDMPSCSVDPNTTAEEAETAADFFIADIERSFRR
ncbi:hypothetical protein [Nonomuraea recticatena]|uniref:hypothetical protein n=1 Tax=Nonomuraea recticatena TaxID=46178 RepID=UPI0031F98D63